MLFTSEPSVSPAPDLVYSKVNVPVGVFNPWHVNQVCRCVPVLRGCREGDQKSRVILGYIENWRPAWADSISKEAR